MFHLHSPLVEAIIIFLSEYILRLYFVSLLAAPPAISD